MKTNGIFVLLLIVLICNSCKQSEVAKKSSSNSSQLTLAELQTIADKGNPKAQYELGDYYYRKGFTELFAEAGISNSNINKLDENKLHQALTKEQRNNLNFFRGVEWFQKSANQNNPEAQEALALAYATGFGTDKDLVEAYKWLTLANAKESNAVSILVENWRTNKITFTPEQIAAGKQRAEEFTKTNQFH
jgi:uncharacterized protein